MIRVKICGLQSEKDVEYACEAGADAAGFLVGQKYPSQDFILPGTARRLAAFLPVLVTPVLVTHYTDPDQVVELIDLTGITTVQLHGGITPEELTNLKDLAGDDVKFLAAIHVMNDRTVEPDMAAFEELVDGFVLDSCDKEKGKVGGTGLTHDWRISAQLVQSTPKKVLLAGGLSPENVEEAVKTVHPYGVDANSRLKDPDGSLDKFLAREFVAKAKGLTLS
ncbi:MAG: phosphoribosylanthranilate isomerase [Lentisphaeria bacterium]|nr:phosphoribosylanthranilate isomerase [Lentisphaeria bacterium]